MSRRLLLFGAVAVLAVLSGCSAAGSIDMTAVNETALADRTSRSLDALSPTQFESERSPRAVVHAAITNGSVTVTATSPPIDGGLPFAFDGAYYDVSHTIVGQERANSVAITIGTTAARNGTAIAYEDLPAADREALEPLVSGSLPALEDDQRVGIAAVYTDAELDASVLAPTQQYDAVVVDGTRYTLTVEDPRPVTVTTYRYEATRVAPNASAYATQVREAYAFSLSGLTAEERSVIRSAVEDGAYYAESTDDAAFRAVLAEFRAHEPVVADHGTGLWVVRYEGTLYVADLHYGAFVE